MKVHTADTIRNIALVGHESTGKTLFAEAVSMIAGSITRMGSIEGNNTQSDYSNFEHDRQKSLYASLLQNEWQGTKYNMIDAPGFSDFIGETKTALHVADIAMVLVSPVNGPEVMTELVMETLDDNPRPCLFVFNALDKDHTRLDEQMQALKDSYKGVAQLQYPLEVGEGFKRIVDILKQKVLVFAEDGSYSEEDLGAEADTVEEMRMALVETVAESDDELMEKFLEEMELSDEDFQRGLASGIASGSIRPVFVSAARKLVGIGRILEVLRDDFPGPDKAVTMHRVKGDEVTPMPADAAGSPAFFVFKTVNEQHVGELVYFRVAQGKITVGLDLVNQTTLSPEKIGSLFSVVGKNRSDISELVAGDMGCTVKLRDTCTNQTLSLKGSDIVVQQIQFPDPVMRTAISPAKDEDEEKMSTGLIQFRREDPSFQIAPDPELGQTILSGQGDQQLKLLLDKLQARFGVQVSMEKPRVPYRETITGNSDVKYRHKKQSGGAGQFGEVWVRFAPNERGAGFEFKSEVVGGSVTVPFQQATEKGMLQVMKEGVIAGCTVVDMVATIYDGKMHPVDSKEIAFQIAGREAFKQGFREAKPILLEPIWHVEVKVPDEYMGDVMGDLSSRRGKILGMDAAGKYQLIKALVPLAELYQYSTTLRSMTQGRASHRRRFDHYEKCPPDVQAKVIEEYEAERNKE